jgi:flagellar hook protein FlgE
MSVTSMFTAVSGMNVNGKGLAVVGDNIANMNTHGFKSSSVVFGDIVSQTVGSLGIGRGALLNDVSQEFTQGSLRIPRTYWISLLMVTACLSSRK